MGLLRASAEPGKTDTPGKTGNPIEDQISRLTNAKAALKTAIEGKGVTVPSGTKLDGMPALVSSISSSSKLQSKTVTPKTTQQTVSPDSGYDGLSSVIVGAMPTATQATPTITVSSSGLITAKSTQTAGYVAAGTKSSTNQLSTQATKTVTPSTSQQTAVASGKYTTGAIYVAGDSNLKAENIKKDISIFGVSGSYEGAGGGGFPNGTAWTQSNIQRYDIYGSCIEYGNGVFVAGCNALGNGIYYSRNGKQWIKCNDHNIECVKYSDGTWIAGVTNGGTYYSKDGISWSSTNMSSSYSLECLCKASGVWVCGNSYGSLSPIAYSTNNGSSWTKATVSSDMSVASITYSDGIFVALSGSGNGLYYSYNGKTWTVSNINNVSGSSVVAANGIWVAATVGNGLYYSVDGKTWSQSNVTSGASSVANANGLWVACCANNGCYYSTDGKTWTPSNVTDVYFVSANYGNNMWVACTRGYGLFYSTDGKKWTQISDTQNQYYNCVKHLNGIWISNRANNGLYYSVTWEPS